LYAYQKEGEIMELRHEALREGRLSSFLLGEMEMSASLMNKLKWGDGIRVNGEPQRTNFAVKPGDLITVRLDEEEPEYPAEDGPLTVLYEDAWLIAVDKPAGMLIHPSHSCFHGTLANYVAGYFARTGQKCAFHPLTRLDRDTFGIVLLAKNAHVHTLLQNTKVQKTYHAWVFGGPEADTGIIDAPIARKPLPSLLREIREDGKKSVTRFRVLKRGAVSLLALQPVTGRTHQLRVHCAYMGYPILGDPQYANLNSAEYSDKLGLKSQLLLAKQLEFIHPITKEKMVLESGMTCDL
jgi:23S rRNA pseudouridine1911/1915/1917 synthase